jgi:hypothetical protein
VFDIEIAVENPSRWQAVCGDLRALLAFLTDDSRSLAFVQAERFHEQCVLFAPGIDPSAAEIRRFLTVNRPTLGSRTSRPAKEVDSDLFAATR